MAQKKPKNRQIDVFGSRIGRVHVGNKETMDQIRPAASLRTALTGHRKRGFDRHKNTAKKKVPADSGPPKKKART